MLRTLSLTLATAAVVSLSTFTAADAACEARCRAKCQANPGVGGVQACIKRWGEIHAKHGRDARHLEGKVFVQGGKTVIRR